MKTILAALILAACTNYVGATPIASFDGPAHRIEGFDGPARAPSFDGPGFGPADVRSTDGPAVIESTVDRR